MKLSEMQTALRRYGFDTNDPITSWLNAGMHQFETEEDWPFLFVSGTETIAAGTTQLTLQSDFSKPVMYKNTTNNMKLSPKDFRQFASEIADASQTGKPSFYVVQAGVIRLWPVPDEEFTLEYVYLKTLADMSDPDVDCPLPTAWHWTAVKAAAMIGLQSESEEERAQTAEDQYQRDLMRARARYHLTDLDEFSSVIDAQEYA